MFDRLRGKARAVWSILLGLFLVVTSFRAGIIDQDFRLGRSIGGGHAYGASAVLYGSVFTLIGGFFVYRGAKDLIDG